MAGFFKVSLKADAAAAPRVNGCDKAIVYAQDEDEAKALVAAASSLDVDAPWLDADVEALTTPADYEGWTFGVTFENSAQNAEYTATSGQTIDQVGTALAAAINAKQTLEGYDFTVEVGILSANVVGDSDDDIDAIAAKLVTALNATAINGASYTASTQTLQTSAAGDALGDEAVTLTVLDPDSNDVSADFTGTIVDEGSSGDATSVVLRNDGFIFSASYNTGTNVLTAAAAVDRLGDTAFEITATPPEGQFPDFDDSNFFTAQDDSGSIADPLLVTLVDALPGSVLFFKT